LIIPLFVYFLDQFDCFGGIAERTAKAILIESVFSLAESALLCLTERIHALLNRFAIPLERDPL
jgi:hypothetical protein